MIRKVIRKVASGAVLLLLMVQSNSVFSQFKLSGEVRPRMEYSHGFGSLAPKDADNGLFVQQRTRFNIDHNNDKYTFKVVFQDIRVWGSQSQLVANDGALSSIHESWALIKFNKNLSLKSGRQEIIYDDHRIFGSVAWAQQARSHDAAILQYKKDGLKVDAGVAYNQNGALRTSNNYTVKKSYKAFQYLWLNKKINEELAASVLFLRHGVQAVRDSAPATIYSNTAGARVTYKKDKLKAAVNFYSQTGEMANENTISAMNYNVDVQYAVHKKHSVGAGYEFLSGNDMVNTVANTNEAFNPFFGTNHKFNGFMDYFYVGNHGGNVGLADIYVNYSMKASKKATIKAAFHSFASDGALADPMSGKAMDKGLGSEVDLVFIYKMNSEVDFKCGYSQMFGTESMEVLKGGDKDETQNWGWLMITVKPTFFVKKLDKK
jgi:hypothetical protein